MALFGFVLQIGMLGAFFKFQASEAHNFCLYTLSFKLVAWFHDAAGQGLHFATTWYWLLGTWCWLLVANFRHQASGIHNFCLYTLSFKLVTWFLVLGYFQLWVSPPSESLPDR